MIPVTLQVQSDFTGELHSDDIGDIFSDSTSCVHVVTAAAQNIAGGAVVTAADAATNDPIE